MRPNRLSLSKNNQLTNKKKYGDEFEKKKDEIYKKKYFNPTLYLA
jgi:hypothetical protein